MILLWLQEFQQNAFIISQKSVCDRCCNCTSLPQLNDTADSVLTQSAQSCLFGKGRAQSPRRRNGSGAETPLMGVIIANGASMTSAC